MTKSLFYNALAFIAFTAFLLVGLKNIDSYGVSFDENIDRYKTLVNLNEINYNLGNPLGLEKQPKGFEDGQEHPNAFQVFQAVCLGLEYLFGIEDDLGAAFRLRHYFVFLLFWLSTICFYFLLRQRVTHLLLPLFFTGLLILQPRIYAHCHFNPKDIVFLSLMIFVLISQYRFMKNPKWWVIFTMSFVTALAINRRMVGLLFPLVFTIVSWFYYTSWIERKKLLLYMPLTLFLLIAMWPTIWNDPFGNLTKLVFIKANLPIESFTWLSGQFYATNNLPWYYVFKWIGISTPIPSLNILIVGQILFWVIVWKYPKHTFYRAFDYYVVICLWLIISIVIIQNPTLYNGWRHFFFLYPLIVYLACVGWQPRYYKRKLLVLGALGFSFAFNMFIMINMNAFHNAYISAIAGSEVGYECYPQDYSGVSYLRLLEKVDHQDKRDRIKVYGHTPLAHNIKLYETLNLNEEPKFVSVASIEEADYFLTHYAWFFVKDAEYKEYEHLQAIHVYHQKRIISTAFRVR